MSLFRMNPASFKRKDIGPVYTPIKYGLLYNWYAPINDLGIVSTSPWEISSFDMIYNLIVYIYTAGKKAGALKSIGTDYWNSPNTGATDIFNFNARGGGARNELTGSFSNLKNMGFWWAYGTEYLQYLKLNYDAASYTILAGGADKSNLGHSIRLSRLCDSSELSKLDGEFCAPYIGNDGKVYHTVKIGDRVWLADNLAETKYCDGSNIPNVTDNAQWAALTTGACCAYDNDPANI